MTDMILPNKFQKPWPLTSETIAIWFLAMFFNILSIKIEYIIQFYLFTFIEDVIQKVDHKLFIQNGQSYLCASYNTIRYYTSLLYNTIFTTHTNTLT